MFYGLVISYRTLRWGINKVPLLVPGMGLSKMNRALSGWRLTGYWSGLFKHVAKGRQHVRPPRYTS